jgi:hypothetical protein
MNDVKFRPFLKLFGISLLISLSSGLANADVSRLRVAGLSGFAKSEILGALTNQSNAQGPMGISAHVDYLLSGQWSIGAEHLRTVSARNGTAVGLTGLSIKNYFWFSHPMAPNDESHITDAQVILTMRALTPYVGMGVGIAQASVLDKNIGALNGFIDVKGGVELPMGQYWGLRSEGNLALSAMGSGSIQFFSLLLGAYVYL